MKTKVLMCNEGYFYITEFQTEIIEKPIIGKLYDKGGNVLLATNYDYKDNTPTISNDTLKLLKEDYSLKDFKYKIENGVLDIIKS